MGPWQWSPLLLLLFGSCNFVFYLFETYHYIMSIDLRCELHPGAWYSIITGYHLQAGTSMVTSKGHPIILLEGLVASGWWSMWSEQGTHSHMPTSTPPLFKSLSFGLVCGLSYPWLTPYLSSWKMKPCSQERKTPTWNKCKQSRGITDLLTKEFWCNWLTCMWLVGLLEG